jgi:hypothetical protein
VNRHGVRLVIRKLGLAILAACGIWIAAIDDGVAQPAGSEWRGRCTHWYRLSLDKPGSRRTVFPYVIDMGIPLQGQTIQTGDDPPISGIFRARGVFTIAIWTESDSEEITSLEFTTPVGVQLEFVSYDGKTRRFVTEGRLSDLPSPLLPPAVCPNDLKPRPGVASPPRPPVAVKRVDEPPVIKRVEEPPVVKRVEEPEGKTIGELIQKFSKGSEPPDAGKRPKSLNELAQEVTRPPEAGPPETPMAKPVTPPRKEAPLGPSVVCGLNFKPLPAPDDLKDMQTVGLRNNKKDAEAYDYVAEVADAVGLNAIADMAASGNKFVPYEAMGRQGDKLWVSVKDSGALRVKPGYRRPAPPVSVRVIVAGGPTEIATSGLDAVGAELGKQSAGRAAVAVEWYPLTDTGSLGPVQRYDSLEDFVRAADEHKAERPAVLDEIQIRAFFDSLEAILIEQTQPVDRVFWIKGPYQVPSTIPARFEQFIEAVHRNSAPVRGHGTWLTVVTARMPGFSIGYLKAPVYSKTIGDVIEEPEWTGGKPRRFITDPKVLAARLWATASTRASTAAAEAGSGAPTPIGKLVFDAKDLFIQRGYVLSFDTVAALQQHLHAVANAVSASNPSPGGKEAIAELAKKTGKSPPILTDLLQNGEGRVLPRLPKGLPEWSRRDLRDLNEADVSEVSKFVTRYLRQVDVTAKEVARQREANETSCSLLYLSEEQLGLQ